MTEDTYFILDWDMYCLLALRLEVGHSVSVRVSEGNNLFSLLPRLRANAKGQVLLTSHGIALRVNCRGMEPVFF